MRNLTRAGLLVAALAVATAACGSSGGSDPNTAGEQRQAVQKLHAYGLSTTEATCIVKAVGAETVVEAPDLGALTAGQPYRDAARSCIHGS